MIRTFSAASPRFAQVLLIAALALGVILSPVVMASPATSGHGVSPRNNNVNWIVAQTCCVDCTYAGDCCCARTTGAKTRTITPTVTKTATVTGNPKKLLARDVPEVEEPATVQEDDHEELIPRADARHLCPVCPAGVAVGKTSGSGNNQYCCPARKTITKTASVKKTTTITKTVVPTGPASVKGRLYVDINNNRVYDPNIDIPIGNSAVNLIRNTTKLARAGSVIGTTVSDPLGLFYFYGVSTIPLELLQIVLQANPNLVLATVQITGTGTPNANIPFAPNQPLCMNFTITTTTTKSSTATITTTLSVTSTRTVTQTPTWSPCPAVPTTVACPACPTTVPPVPTTTKTGGLVCNTPYGVFTTMYLNAVNSTTYLWSSTLTSTSTFVTVTTTTSYSPTEDVYEDTLTYSYYSSTLTGTQVNVVTETSYGEYVTTSATLCGPTTTAGPS